MSELTPIPWIDHDDVLYIERTLLGLGKDHLRILEWGAGGSTLYFTRFLHERGIAYEWFGVDNDPAWYERVRKKAAGDHGIHLALYPFGRFNMLPRKERAAYVAHGTTLGGLFDAIIVDGRERARCLREAYTLLAPGGIVFLHDAERLRYQSAMRGWKKGRIVSPPGQKKRLLWEAR
jgi:SAM-dependent methyltransferase